MVSYRIIIIHPLCKTTKLIEQRYMIFSKHACVLCGQYKKLANLSICQGCYDDMPLFYQNFYKDDIDPMMTAISASCQYAFPATDILFNFKYRQDMALLPVIVDLFLTLPKPSKNTFLVPMPSSPNRLKQRGYDHIYVLTKQLAKKWQLPIWQGIKRIGQAQQQKGLNRKNRLANLNGQFVVQGLPPTGHQLLLIDDVCTTGSTIAAVAACLAQTKLSISAYVLLHKV